MQEYRYHVARSLVISEDVLGSCCSFVLYAEVVYGEDDSNSWQ